MSVAYQAARKFSANIAKTDKTDFHDYALLNLRHQNM
jgi:hypothetical protein